MILAAGLGTRLRPITDHTPKPLVKISGKPMIDYALEALVEAGARTIVVNVHYLAEQMINHLHNFTKAEIIISDESEALLDSGGGLVKGLKRLEAGPVFVMNADLFWVGENKNEPSNLRKLNDFFNPDIMDMALLCVPLERTTGHNGKKDFQLNEDGRLTRYQEGDPNPIVYTGAIAMDSGLLDDAPEGSFNLNIYFDRAIRKKRLFGILLQGHWITVGSPDAIEPAEQIIGHYTKKE